MLKTCEVCATKFTTKEGRQKACSKKCADVLRSRNAVTSSSTPFQLPQSKPVYIKEEDLPSPDVLPAAYLKKCADYWNTLVDGDVPVKRIA